MDRSMIALARADDVRGSVGRVMHRGGILSSIPAGGTVLVKPNFAVQDPRPGVTTSPGVLEAVLEVLKDRAGRVLVGEAYGGYASFTADQAFRSHGLYEICKRTGAEPVDLSADPPVRVRSVVLGREVDVLLSPRVLGKVDATISVPVVKTHFVTTVSLGLKNLWGCDADGMRLLRRKYLARRIALIAKTLHARFTVVDGTTALDGYGPIEGKPVPLGLVAAGNDIVATDATIARWMGFDPQRIPIITTAHRAGLGTMTPELIDVDAPSNVPRHQFHLERDVKDHLIRMTFHSKWLSRTVYDSTLTPRIYRLFKKDLKTRHLREHGGRPPGNG